jgi:predicted Zn-dependent protease
MAFVLAVHLSAQFAPSTAPPFGNPAASPKLTVKSGSIDDVNAVGRRRIGRRGIGNWYSAATEARMGKLYAAEIEKNVPLVNDPVVNEFVSRMGQRLVSNSDCKASFTIRVIDSEEINAFALPGGYLYVTAGLIRNAGDEAELAGVMAHEIAHVCAHHATRGMTRMNYAQLGAMPLVMAGGWAGVGVPAAFMQYSQEFEVQADYLGVQYMYRAGYDPQAYIRYFERLQALQQRGQVRSGSVIKTFGSHPSIPDRIQRTREEIARILPAQGYLALNTEELDTVKARLQSKADVGSGATTTPNSVSNGASKPRQTQTEDSR